MIFLGFLSGFIIGALFVIYIVAPTAVIKFLRDNVGKTFEEKTDEATYEIEIRHKR